MKALSRLTKNFRNDQRGVAMLEMAMVLPVLLAIGLGVIEFGNAIYNYHLIENGVRDGARYVAGLRYDASDTALLAANKTAAQNITVYGVTSTGTPRVTGWTTSTVLVAYDPPIANGPTSCGSTKCYRGGDTITMVTVTATVPYQSLGLLAFFGLTAPTLSVSHQERVYGVR